MVWMGKQMAIHNGVSCQRAVIRDAIHVFPLALLVFIINFSS